MISVGLVVKMVAKPETAEEVSAFLISARELAAAEAGTVVWHALRTDETTFWIVDAFADDTARQAHLNGEIAAALMANADRLLSEPPQIMFSDVLASLD